MIYESLSNIDDVKRTLHSGPGQEVSGNDTRIWQKYPMYRRQWVLIGLALVAYPMASGYVTDIL